MISMSEVAPVPKLAIASLVEMSTLRCLILKVYIRTAVA